MHQCDGRRPKCSICADQDLECVYAAGSGSNKAQVPKMFVKTQSLPTLVLPFSHVLRLAFSTLSKLV